MSNSSFLIFHSSLQAKPAVVGSNGLEPSTSRLSGVRSNHLSYEPVLQPVVINQPDVAANTLAYLRRFSRSEKLQWPARFQSAKPLLRLVSRLAAGGDEQNRTVDPLLARQVLSQLSYAPILGLCLGESTLLSSLFGGPSKLNSVTLTRNHSQHLFRSTWMIEPSIK